MPHCRPNRVAMNPLSEPTLLTTVAETKQLCEQIKTTWQEILFHAEDGKRRFARLEELGRRIDDSRARG